MDAASQAQGRAVHTAFTKRLERLVYAFLAPQIEARQLFRLQRDLLELQQDIQAEISNLKPGSRKSVSRRNLLEEVRQLHRFSKRLGDAIAWFLLGGRRNLIDPLANKERVSTDPSSGGNLPVLSIGAVLADRGLGFPIFHDITDLLRIGDISFIRTDRSIITVEVKAKTLCESPGSGGKTAYDFSIRTFASARIDDGESNPFSAILLGVGEGEGGSKLNARVSEAATDVGAPSARLQRQLERMDHAYALQTAKAGQLLNLGDSSTLIAKAELSQESHAAVVRRLVMRARRLGEAFESVDRTFLYAAFYDANGVSAESVASDGIEYSVLTSGFTDPSGEDEGVMVWTVPHDQETKDPELHIPFYLYPFPKTNIVDIVYGRLVIAILINRGRIVAALNSAGHTVRVSEGDRPWPDGPLNVEWSITSDSGRGYSVMFGDLTWYVRDMIYEFHGIQYLVDLLAAARNAVIAQVNERERSGYVE